MKEQHPCGDLRTGTMPGETRDRDNKSFSCYFAARASFSAESAGWRRAGLFLRLLCDLKTDS